MRQEWLTKSPSPTISREPEESQEPCAHHHTPAGIPPSSSASIKANRDTMQQVRVDPWIPWLIQECNYQPRLPKQESLLMLWRAHRREETEESSLSLATVAFSICLSIFNHSHPIYFRRGRQNVLSYEHIRFLNMVASTSASPIRVGESKGRDKVLPSLEIGSARQFQDLDFSPEGIDICGLSIKYILTILQLAIHLIRWYFYSYMVLRRSLLMWTRK